VAREEKGPGDLQAEGPKGDEEAMITIEIPGKPIAKKRPRFARIGKYVQTYSDQQTEEGRFLWELRRQWKEAPMERPLSLVLIFTLPIPQSTSRKKADLMARGILFPDKKPDLDNFIKFSLDCMNGHVWRDDSQIIKIEAHKIYGQQSKTTISIFPL
jgi:Holliday junction resolvase RusA-like endonuclease